MSSKIFAWIIAMMLLMMCVSATSISLITDNTDCTPSYPRAIYVDECFDYSGDISTHNWNIPDYTGGIHPAQGALSLDVLSAPNGATYDIPKADKIGKIFFKMSNFDEYPTLVEILATSNIKSITGIQNETTPIIRLLFAKGSIYSVSTTALSLVTTYSYGDYFDDIWVSVEYDIERGDYTVNVYDYTQTAIATSSRQPFFRKGYGVPTGLRVLLGSEYCNLMDAGEGSNGANAGFILGDNTTISYPYVVCGRGNCAGNLVGLNEGESFFYDHSDVTGNEFTAPGTFSKDRFCYLDSSGTLQSSNGVSCDTNTTEYKIEWPKYSVSNVEIVFYLSANVNGQNVTPQLGFIGKTGDIIWLFPTIPDTAANGYNTLGYTGWTADYIGDWWKINTTGIYYDDSGWQLWAYSSQIMRSDIVKTIEDNLPEDRILHLVMGQSVRKYCTANCIGSYQRGTSMTSAWDLARQVAAGSIVSETPTPTGDFYLEYLFFQFTLNTNDGICGSGGSCIKMNSPGMPTSLLQSFGNSWSTDSDTQINLGPTTLYKELKGEYDLAYTTQNGICQHNIELDDIGVWGGSNNIGINETVKRSINCPVEDVDSLWYKIGYRQIKTGSRYYDYTQKKFVTAGTCTDQWYAMDGNTPKGCADIGDVYYNCGDDQTPYRTQGAFIGAFVGGFARWVWTLILSNFLLMLGVILVLIMLVFAAIGLRRR